MRIGFDFGNTIIIDGNENTTIVSLIRILGPTNELYLISKCGPEAENDTVQWLGEHGLSKHFKHRYYFVRNTWDKEPVIRALGLDAYFDDRLDILASIRTGNIKLVFVEGTQLTIVKE